MKGFIKSPAAITFSLLYLLIGGLFLLLISEQVRSQAEPVQPAGSAVIQLESGALLTKDIQAMTWNPLEDESGNFRLVIGMHGREVTDHDISQQEIDHLLAQWKAALAAQ